MGAEGPLVGPPVFKTDGDGAPVLVCSIRTRPRQNLRRAFRRNGRSPAVPGLPAKTGRSAFAGGAAGFKIFCAIPNSLLRS